MNNNLQQWVAEQINWNMFEGCQTREDVISVMTDCEPGSLNYELTDIINEACIQLEINQ